MSRGVIIGHSWTWNWHGNEMMIGTVYEGNEHEQEREMGMACQRNGQRHRKGIDVGIRMNMGMDMVVR